MVSITRSGRRLAFAGAVAQLVGLSWDAVLHRLDPELAAREGIFTLSNPGHLLFAGGLALVVAGLGLLLLGDAPFSGMQAGRRALALRVLPVAALLALSAGSLALAATSEGGLTGHSHEGDHGGVVHVHEDGTEHTHAEHEAFVAAQGGTLDGHDHAHPATTPGISGGASVAAVAGGHDHGVPGGDSSRHQEHADIPIALGDLTKLNEQVETARAATEKYLDVRVALRDGYIQVTQDLPGIAAHFINPLLAADGVFDPARPEILLYAKQDGRWNLVGMSYSMPQSAGGTPPEGFAGPLDTWHYHSDLCFRGASVISAAMDRSQCGAAGGRFVKNTGWMMHLWLWQEAPEGLFAHSNSTLKGSGATLTRAEIAALGQ